MPVNPAQLHLAAELSEELFDVLEKTAAEHDQMSSELARVRGDLTKVAAENQALKAQIRPALDPTLLEKLASRLEAEGLLDPGIDAVKAASALQENPNRLIAIAYNILTPAQSDGRPIKAASVIDAATEQSASDILVEFNGRTVIDHDGWLNAIR